MLVVPRARQTFFTYQLFVYGLLYQATSYVSIEQYVLPVLHPKRTIRDSFVRCRPIVQYRLLHDVRRPSRFDYLVTCTHHGGQ